MTIQFLLNNKKIAKECDADSVLLDVLRDCGCYSVKRGCETSNCGICSVWVEDKVVLSCSTLAVRVNGKQVTTLEGVETEAAEFGKVLASFGAEQCGFCSPGFMMTVLMMKRELKDPNEQDIKNYLSGNLCRCTGYMGQLRAINKFMGVDSQ